MSIRKIIRRKKKSSKRKREYRKNYFLVIETIKVIKKNGASVRSKLFFRSEFIPSKFEDFAFR